MIENSPIETLDADLVISSKLLEFIRCTKCQSILIDGKRSLQCSQCGDVYPVIDNIPRFYCLTERETNLPSREMRNPETWTDWRHLNYEYIKTRLKDVPKPAIVLDVGAGPSHFKDLLNPYIHYSIDFKPYPDIDILTDLTKPLPIRSEYFDVIIMSNVLEHIPTPLILLQEVYRVLKSGGKLIMVTPFLIKIHQAPYDFLRFTEYMFQYLFSGAGFSSYQIDRIGNVVDVYTVVTRSLNKYLLTERSISKLRYLVIKNLLLIERKIHKACIKTIMSDIRSQKDTIGYPQGYGCVAIK